MKTFRLLQVIVVVVSVSLPAWGADARRAIKDRLPERKTTPVSREPWSKWAREPASLRLIVTAQNIYAASNASQMTIILADGKVSTNGIGCDADMGTNINFVSNLQLRKEY